MKLHHHVSRLLCIAAFLLASLLTSQAQRVALIVGNNAYPKGRLINPINDATALKAELEEAGWTVILATDTSARELRGKIREFCTAGRGAEAGLFYFAGHGIEHSDSTPNATAKNYLLPVDATLASVDDLDAECVELRAGVLQKMSESGMRLKTVLLDCCRNNPLKQSRSWLRGRGDTGLSEVKSEQLPEGTLLVFAASPGKTAPDGEGNNSPFAAAFIKEIGAGGSASEVIARVSEGVSESEPWVAFDSSGKSFAAFQKFSFWPGRRNGGGGGDNGEMRELTPATATKEKPFRNSLGMEFVPAGTPGVLFCKWETRVQDFKAFVDETGFKVGTPMYCLGKDKDTDGTFWKDRKHTWDNPGFEQGDTHPLVGVSYDEFQKFLEWLSKKEKRLYRLPKDAEWSRACGGDEFPWGNLFPPKATEGNYAGEEANDADWPSDYSVISSRNDRFARTSPVGRFSPNAWGLYDIGGNVFEFCQDWYSKDMNTAATRKAVPVLDDDGGGQKYRVLRGGSWVNGTSVNCSSAYRFGVRPNFRLTNYGFRVVLVVAGGG